MVPKLALAVTHDGQNGSRSVVTGIALVARIRLDDDDLADVAADGASRLGDMV